jgi:hypothetical protein
MRRVSREEKTAGRSTALSMIRRVSQPQPG